MDSTTLQRNSRRMKKEVPAIVEDLIMVILLRLPPVSVLRFKCVSKSWYSLISNPPFFRNHAAQFHLSQLFHPLMEPPALLVSPTPYFPDYDPQCVYTLYTILGSQHQEPDQDQDQDQKQKPNSSYLKVFLDHSLPEFELRFSHCFLINSCNGLLLYHTKSGTSNQYTVFNPITNQYKQVPLMKTFNKLNELADHPRIVFDPSKSLSYKLLAVIRGPPYTHFQLYVYSDDTGSWKRLASLPNKYITSWITFMFNGVFYWLCHRDSICFDFVEDTVWFLPLPQAPEECPDCNVLYFGEFGGRLRLIQEYRDGNVDATFACSFDIMEREVELGSRIWTMKPRVNLEADQETSNPLKRVVVKVMHLYKTEKGEEVVLLNVDDENVIPFNITTQTVGKELTIVTIPYIEHLDCLNAFPFTPTLYPLLM